MFILIKSYHPESLSSQIMSQFDGQRNKIVACDGNEIDTMFVDRRRDGGQNGQTLVNACNHLLCLCLGLYFSQGPTKTLSHHSHYSGSRNV